MPRKPAFPIRVFYDGSCSICATEIEHYLRLDYGERLLAVDVSSPDFAPEPFHIPLAAFMYELHVIDNTGRTYKGVEAFWAIWQAFPASTLYGLLAAVITIPLITPVARLFYKGFARMRPYLPKRHTCSSGNCQIRGNSTDQP